MPAGRPRAFKSVKKLQDKIDDYLAQDEPKSIAGLAAFFEVSKETIYAYQRGDHGEQFSDPIKKVVHVIEAKTVNGLLAGKLNPAGSIFVLKNNFGYKDVQHINSKGKSVTEVKLDKKSAKTVTDAVRDLIQSSL